MCSDSTLAGTPNPHNVLTPLLQSCLRCIKANRPCGGYEHGVLFPFREYTAQSTHAPASYLSTARKCGIPKRVPIPGTDMLPEDTIPREVSQAESDGLAL